jgi:hypothetical protein
VAQLVTKLGLPETDKERQDKAEKLSQVRRRAAKLRLAR